ncbi:MAG: saccharopine dehydrogenase-like protein [Monoraphidium minutum]|nr:MAG: saccharopine dehydrogenase-like protein [Monoraphidium minutum]
MHLRGLSGARVAPAGRRSAIQRSRVVLCHASDKKKVVVVGGTGRVGSATASSLVENFSDVYEVAVAGRTQENFDKIVQLRPRLQGARFVTCDITDLESVKATIAGADLVVHTAGPFQQSSNFNVIEAAIQLKVPYMDVCDDTTYSEGVKAYSDRAAAAGVPALTTAGIYPGTSNVMAAHIVSIARGEYDDEWNYKTPEEGEGVEPELLRYSYYTAGSGGAGPTILETSFLLAGEDCTVYKGGEAFKLPPISNPRNVDFGPGIGRKGTYLYNLPEVQSAYRYMKVPGVSARFGTDPFIWNWAMWLVARLVPRRFLQNRSQVRWLRQLSDPWVRAVDKIAGEAVAMRVEVDFAGAKNSSGIYVHRRLPEAMGNSVAAFAHAVLQGGTAPGVWYPEEREALADRRAFLEYAAKGCSRFELNRSAWALESEVKQIGGLIYW